MKTQVIAASPQEHAQSEEITGRIRDELGAQGLCIVWRDQEGYMHVSVAGSEEFGEGVAEHLAMAAIQLAHAKGAGMIHEGPKQ